jgi:glyoxylase-like metal-dependent hydrolase (beta-lactamase superfamily II)
VDALAPIDLRFGGRERVIGVYLLETEDGPALFDCGPATCVERLKEGLAERGLALTDLRHLFLSHIHLDHAGAAGVLVREHPGLRVHVSEVGAPHLVDPERLERSARRLYGADFDTLWGELAPVPERNVEVTGRDVVGLECFPSPGHAKHHVCYLDRGETLYAGDAAGVRIPPSRYVMPPTPPPEIDLEAWDATLDDLERRAPERLALIHFGVVSRPAPHLAELRRRLHEWAAIVERGASEEEFVATAGRDVDEAERAAYDSAVPLWQSYAGLKRYWEKRREAA